MSRTALRVIALVSVGLQPGPFEDARTIKNRRNKVGKKNRRTIEKKRRRAARQ